MVFSRNCNGPQEIFIIHCTKVALYSPILLMVDFMPRESFGIVMFTAGGLSKNSVRVVREMLMRGGVNEGSFTVKVMLKTPISL